MVYRTFNIFIMGRAFCTKCHVFMNLQICSQVKKKGTIHVNKGSGNTVSASLDGYNMHTDCTS